MGRFSFLGVGARALVTYQDGRLTVQENGDRLSVEHDDPFAAVAELIRSYRPPTSGVAAACRRSPAASSATSATTSCGGSSRCRTRRPTTSACPRWPSCWPTPCSSSTTSSTPSRSSPTPSSTGATSTAPTSAPWSASRTCATSWPRPCPPARPGAWSTRRRSRRGGTRRAAAGGPAPRAVTSSMTREQYEAGVERIREYIYAGDAFQVVLSQRFSTPVDVLAVLHLPRPARREPEPVPVLHRLRRLRPLRLQPRAAGHRPGRARGDAAHRRHAPARRDRRRGPAASWTTCSPTRRSAPSTSCSSTWAATTSAASACRAPSRWTSSWRWSSTRTSSTWSRR